MKCGASMKQLKHSDRAFLAANARSLKHCRDANAAKVLYSLWLILTRCARAAILLPICGTLANALTTRDILYLHQYGPGIHSISWCSEGSLTYLQAQPDTHTDAILNTESLSRVNLTAPTSKEELLRFYQNTSLQAVCLKGGSYVYVSGNTPIVTLPSSFRAAPNTYFNIVDISSKGLSNQFPLSFPLKLTRSFYSGSPITASDGSVVGEMQSREIDMPEVESSRRRQVVDSGVSFSIVQNELAITYIATGGRRPFLLFGLAAPEHGDLGSYQCPGMRPGCVGAAARNSVYYIYSQYWGGDKRTSSLFTVTPFSTPPQKRWPISAINSINNDRFVISSVALDERRCYILLEPNPQFASSRVNGRLRLDYYIADCNFGNRQLLFGEPHVVGHKSASFIVPNVTLNGEFTVITEKFDMSAQVPDQEDAERKSAADPILCAHFYLPKSPAVDRSSSSLCVHIFPDASGASVSAQTPVLLRWIVRKARSLSDVNIARTARSRTG
jgi:hypothetical protein